MNTYQRKGTTRPEKLVTSQSSEETKPKTPSAGRETSTFSGAHRNASRTLTRKQELTKPSPKKSAIKLLHDLATKFDVLLVCAQCFPEEAKRPSSDSQHACKESTLVLQEQGTTRYQRVRSVPFRPDLAKLCESFINDMPCDERERCPRPHAEAERIMWTLSHRYACTVSTFIEQLKTTSLKCTTVVRQLCEENNGKFLLYCATCLNASPPKYTKKNYHSPFCKDNHHWSRPALVFETLEEAQRYEIGREGKSENQKIADAIRKLYSAGFDNDDIAQESKKFRQSQFHKTKHGMLRKHVVQLSEISGRYTSDYADECNTNCEELTEMMGEIPYGGDVYSPGDVLEENGNEKNPRKMKAYYKVLKPADLKTRMAEKPEQYKQCIIQLDGPHEAVCRMCDHGPQDEPREIQVRGRINCGPAMDGDTVVVEIVKTEVLGEDVTVERGRVVGVIAHGFNRKAYTFVCTVDQYQSNLMKPVCGSAAKIHVLDHHIKYKFQNNPKLQQSKVVIYKAGENGLVCDEIVNLNLKNKHDRLFGVKYLRWDHGYIYPLGYVCAVLPAGTDIQRGMAILNVMYQVPQPIPEEDQRRDREHSIDMKKRTDMRDMPTVSIDPPGCQDIDDALSITKSKQGTKMSAYRVTVHIADVSDQVRIGDRNDEEAKRRMTSYYPGGGRSPIHMLPGYLIRDRCSLKAGEDRLALSVAVTVEDDGSWDVKTLSICESIIQNDTNMTYRNAQDIIDNNHSAADFDSTTRTIITTLYRLAYKLREKRMGGGQFFCELRDTFDGDGCPEAYNLVAEFMILANKAVAQYLTSNYDEEVPLRHQADPSRADLITWNEANKKVRDYSMYFQQFKNVIDRVEASDEESHGSKDNPASEPSPNSVPAGPTTNNKHIPLTKATVQKIHHALSTSNEHRARHLFCTERLHPLHAIAMTEWYKIQERAQYVHSGNSRFKEKGHFSLQTDSYVQFTSPIRRYLDIVVHRLVKAKLIHGDCPYSAHEINEMCDRANRIQSSARRYHKATKLLEDTAVLREKALFLPATAITIDDGGIGLRVSSLSTMKTSEQILRYSNMDVEEKPKLENQNVALHFMKRIYDADPNTRLARTKQQSMEQSELNPNGHLWLVAESEWKTLVKTIKERPHEFAEMSRAVFDPQRERSLPSTVIDISSEMQGDTPIIRHHADFGFTVEKAGVVQVQLSTRNLQGLMTPMISLMNLSPQLDICLEHSKQPVACFAELATRFTKKAYHSVEEYQEVWKPLISMESAQAAVQDGQPIVIHNVKISMHKSNDTYYGFFELTTSFSFKRQIKLLKNSKGDDEDANDFLCIRIPLTPFSKTGIQHRYREVWLAHAVAICVSPTTGDSVKCDFKLQRFSCPPPDDMLTKNRVGVAPKLKLMKGTVEILPKPLPFRRMEEAVVDLLSPETTALCKSIALGPWKVQVQVDEVMRSVLPISLDITARSTDMHIRGQHVIVPLPPNNEKQNEAITKALTQTFTVIQGPPGTGKTLTGVKLVYHFVQMNQELSKRAPNGTTRRQVLYCGPSNSAVDVAARFLFERLGDKCPKIVRVYSENLEKFEFPIPREYLNIKARGRKFELLGKEMHKEIALHHLVRREGKNGSRFAKRIKSFDSLFARNKHTPENVSDEEVEQYQKLLTDACKAEIKKYDVILATCSASPSNRIQLGANVTQCIIDECGMCQEPESLIPLVCFKPKQVVLIGDHKQLQPIITNQVVKDLGMANSLFERHSENAIMLDTQYRMHPAICEFPSRQFYEGKLKTVSTRQWNEEYLDIWPQKHIPVVFCHVAGAEQVLNVATKDGSAQSKSNWREVVHSARIFAELCNRYKVSPKKVCVLSQYKAQCSEITRQLQETYGFVNANVSTVVASQGGEWDYVILSTVRSLPDYEIDECPSLGWLKRHLGFITDHHQINVAITRAKRGMIIVGNRRLLSCDRMWKDLLKSYKDREIIMPAEDFPLDVKAYEDRKTQLGNNAEVRRRFGLLSRKERKELIQREQAELKAWQNKQDAYNPYANE